jgi:site-specific recombinase XerD
MLAEAGATTRELRAILGHDDIAHAELYSREAEQRGFRRNAQPYQAWRTGWLT